MRRLDGLRQHGRRPAARAASTSRGSAACIVDRAASTIADNIGGERAASAGSSSLVAARAQVAGSILARNLGGSVDRQLRRRRSPPTAASTSRTTTELRLRSSAAVNPGWRRRSTNAGGEIDVLAIAAAQPRRRPAPGRARTAPPARSTSAACYRPQGAGVRLRRLRARPGRDDDDHLRAVRDDRDRQTSQFDFSSNEPGVEPGLPAHRAGPDRRATSPVTSPTRSRTPASRTARYTFSVRDGAFPSSTPATRTFTVAALDTTITGGPTGPTNDTTPTFTFTGTSGARRFQCRFDAAAFAACTSPFTTAARSPRARTRSRSARSTPPARRPDARVARVHVDTIAPDTTITGGPDRHRRTRPRATFTFTSTEAGATFQCRSTAPRFGACPAALHRRSAQGSHTFQVRAIDTAGNIDATPATQHARTVDTVAPDTTITGGPDRRRNVDQRRRSRSPPPRPASTFQCALDGAAFGACPPSYTGLARARTPSRSARSTPPATSTPSPATRTWTVDTVAPEHDDHADRDRRRSDSTPTFTFTSDEPARRSSAASTAPPSRPAPRRSPPRRSRDGHPHLRRSAPSTPPATSTRTPATQTFVVDTGAPDTTIAAGPTGADQRRHADVHVHAPTRPARRSSAASTAARSRPAPRRSRRRRWPTARTPSRSARSTPPATSTRRPRRRAFTVDTTPPPRRRSSPARRADDRTPRPRSRSTPPRRPSTCRLDGPTPRPASFGPCASPKGFGALAPGDYVFIVRSTDAAGNAQTSSRAFTVTAPQQATPTPTPTRRRRPRRRPTPVANQSVVVAPGERHGPRQAAGHERRSCRSTSPRCIPNGSEVDARKGRVELTRSRRRRPPRPRVLRRPVQRHPDRRHHRPDAEREAHGLPEGQEAARARRGQEAEDPQAVGRRQGQVPHQGPVQRGDRARHQVARPGHLHDDADARRPRASSRSTTSSRRRRSWSRRASATPPARSQEAADAQNSRDAFLGRGGLGVEAARDAAGAVGEAAAPRCRGGSRGPSSPGPRRGRSRSRTARRRSRAPSPARRRRRCRCRRRGSPGRRRARGSAAGCTVFSRPMPEPIGEPSGITAAQPTSSRRRARIGSSLVYGQDDEAVVDELLGGLEQRGRVGQQRALVADDLELDPVGLERLAGELRGQHGVAGGEAAGGVGQQLARRRGRARRRSSRAGDGSIRRSATVTSSRAGDRERARPARRASGSRPCRAAAASAAPCRRWSGRRCSYR